jgi:hypothetical protein
MNAAKSPGAVAARGAVEIDELGWHVISQSSPLQIPTQARIRAALTQCNDGCDAGFNLSRADETVEDTELSLDIPQASAFRIVIEAKRSDRKWSARLGHGFARVERWLGEFNAFFSGQKNAGLVAVLPWPDRHRYCRASGKIGCATSVKNSCGGPQNDRRR